MTVLGTLHSSQSSLSCAWLYILRTILPSKGICVETCDNPIPIYGIKNQMTFLRYLNERAGQERRMTVRSLLQEGYKVRKTKKKRKKTGVSPPKKSLTLQIKKGLQGTCERKRRRTTGHLLFLSLVTWSTRGQRTTWDTIVWNFLCWVDTDRVSPVSVGSVCVASFMKGPFNSLSRIECYLRHIQVWTNSSSRVTVVTTMSGIIQRGREEDIKSESNERKRMT